MVKSLVKYAKCIYTCISEHQFPITLNYKTHVSQCLIMSIGWCVCIMFVEVVFVSCIVLLFIFVTMSLFKSLPPAAMSDWDCTSLLYLVLFKPTGSFCFITVVPLVVHSSIQSVFSLMPFIHPLSCTIMIHWLSVCMYICRLYVCTEGGKMEGVHRH